MVEIKKFENRYYQDFVGLFCDYFALDLGEDAPTQVIKDKIIDAQVLKDFELGDTYLDLLILDGVARGFIIYQIDSERSDWNKRTGFGFIRELYVDRNYRKCGYGSMLLKNAEDMLRGKTNGVYLTSDEKPYVKDFYIRNGYTNEHIRDDYNNDEYFVKYFE